MYNNEMLWCTLICLVLLTAVFVYQMKIRFYGGTSVFHKIWCLTRGIYYKITSVAGYGITRLQSRGSREPEELLKCPLGGSVSGVHRRADPDCFEKRRRHAQVERQRRQYKMKILH